MITSPLVAPRPPIDTDTDVCPLARPVNWPGAANSSRPEFAEFQDASLVTSRVVPSLWCAIAAGGPGGPPALAALQREPAEVLQRPRHLLDDVDVLVLDVKQPRARVARRLEHRRIVDHSRAERHVGVVGRRAGGVVGRSAFLHVL